MTNVANMVLSTDEDTSKYLSFTPYTTSFSSAAVSVPSASHIIRNYTIPLSADTDFYDLWVNYTRDGDTRYYKLPMHTRYYASFAQVVQTVAEASSGSVTLSVWLINQGGSAQTFPAFNINVVRRDYID